MKFLIYATIPLRAALSLLWFCFVLPVCVIVLSITDPKLLQEDLSPCNREVIDWVIQPDRPADPYVGGFYE